MKSFECWFRRILLAVCVAGSCRSAPEFSGVLTSGGKTYVGLRDDARTGFVWCTVGDRLGEFLVDSYEEKTETVRLKRGNTVVELRLKDSAVEPAPTVALVEQLARNGDQALQKMLPDLRTLGDRRDRTAAELADLELRAATDQSARERVVELRRKLKIEDDNLAFFLQRIVGSARRGAK